MGITQLMDSYLNHLNEKYTYTFKINYFEQIFRNNPWGKTQMTQFSNNFNNPKVEKNTSGS